MNCSPLLSKHLSQLQVVFPDTETLHIQSVLIQPRCHAKEFIFMEILHELYILLNQIYMPSSYFIFELIVNSLVTFKGKENEGIAQHKPLSVS